MVDHYSQESQHKKITSLICMSLRSGDMFIVFLVCLCLFSPLDAQLQVGFYRKSCSEAESIVRDEVTKALIKNRGLAAGLVRLHFHDAFVRGTDGSVLIDSTANNTAEKSAPPNNPSLRGFEVIDSAKRRLEGVCKGTVSCADILAFAARDSVLLSMGIRYSVPSGRRDGRVSLASEALSNLPPPTLNLAQLTQSFASKGLTQDEMITLVGAHTIGRSHCNAFTNRLYNFNSTGRQDPSLDSTYAAQLKRSCPNNSSSANLVVPLDPVSPNIFDTNYYKLVLANRGLFTSDQSLISTPATAAKVRAYANNANLFQRKFSAAMVKMGKIGVLTGKQGEIRSVCNKIN
ncbi:putative peroxidase [Dioscorea sansibarensis]